jgi:hypothetical protein
MTVDSTSRIALYSGGTKISEQAVGNNTPSIPLTVAALRFGATEPNGYTPGSFLIEQVSGWIAPLVENNALLVSSDLNYVPPVAEVPKPVVSIPSSLSVKEGDTLQIPITKNGVGACSVQLRTIGGTALTPADYTGFLQVFSFGANDTIINVPLVTILDAEPEGDHKLKIELSLPTNCTLGNSSGEITITEPPRISVPTTASVKEGGILSLIVSKVGAGACSVTWRTSADTAFVHLSDYLGQDVTTLSFGANETQKTITVTTLTDALVEGTEYFNILLENPTGCTITTATCKVALLDANSPETPVQTALTQAVGFASAADCGLGLPVYKVTNLNDSGAGSFRQGAAAGNCMIVFEVGGTIELLTRLNVGANCTIAGETAPAPGITLIKGDTVTTHTQDTIHIVKSNIRISHITFEKGYHANLSLGNSDVVMIAPDQGTPPSPQPVVENIHFSHCAFYWSMDETISLYPGNYWICRNISFHDCIIAEPLWKPSTYDSTLSNHPKVDGPPYQSQHNYGLLVGHETRKVDLQYCLFADMDMREPFIDRSTEVVLANNIANNCTKGATIQQNPDQYDSSGKLIYNIDLLDSSVYKITCKGYLCISGPNTGTSIYGGFRFNSYRVKQPKYSAVHVSGLYGMKGGPANSTYQTPKEVVTYGSSSTGYDGVVGKPYWLDGTVKKAVEVSTPPIDTPTATVGLTGQEIYDRALLNVGPRPKEIRALMAGTMTIGNKDVRRTVQRLKDKTGAWVNHQDEYGGYYKATKVDRTLNATAKFPDGTLIGEIPAQPQPATATSKASMKAWLRKHLDQIQND